VSLPLSPPHSIFCSYNLNAGSGLAPCTGELTMFTAWHKTTALSSLAASFWTSSDSFTEGLDPEEFSIVAPVVTGRTGAWPKVEAITSITTEPRESLLYPIELTINYKVSH
jgi:hypothetical protein